MIYIHLVDKNKFDKANIQLYIQRVEASAWTEIGFDKHHYLTSELNKSAKCFIFYWGSKIVGFCGVLNAPRKDLPESCSISRTVVLPDFQGLGIGAKMTNFIGGIFSNSGYIIYTKTANPALGIYRDNSPYWEATPYNHKTREVGDPNYKNRLSRWSYCHKYIGGKITGYEELLKNIEDMRKDRLNDIVKIHSLF